MVIKNPVNFITICHERSEDRKNQFKKYLEVSYNKFNTSWSNIEEILEFVSQFDAKIDKIVEPSHLNFMFDAHHNTISSDLNSIILLFLSNQKISMNIILRHLIETSIYCLFADIVSKFSGAFYPLYYTTWKPYRTHYKLSWKNKNFNRGISERLAQINKINNSIKEEKFYKHYFSKCNNIDIEILFFFTNMFNML